MGLIQSLRHPGGNITGTVSVVESLTPKLVQLLREISPDLKVIGYLSNPEDPRWKIDGDALVLQRRSLGISVLKGSVADPRQLEAAVEALVRQGAQAIVTGASITFNLRDDLFRLSSRHRMPVAAHRSEMTDAGALLSYGPSLKEQIRLSARLVDRVLKGQRPGDIPVEQPKKFELVINQNTARSLGLAVPPALLLRADRVVE